MGRWPGPAGVQAGHSGGEAARRAERLNSRAESSDARGRALAAGQPSSGGALAPVLQACRIDRLRASGATPGACFRSDHRASDDRASARSAEVAGQRGGPVAGANSDGPRFPAENPERSPKVVPPRARPRANRPATGRRRPGPAATPGAIPRRPRRGPSGVGLRHVLGARRERSQRRAALAMPPADSDSRRSSSGERLDGEGRVHQKVLEANARVETAEYRLGPLELAAAISGLDGLAEEVHRETGTNRGLGGGLPGLPGDVLGPKCLQWLVSRGSSFRNCVPISGSSPRFVPLSYLTMGPGRPDRLQADRSQKRGCTGGYQGRELSWKHRFA
jgi:hypothetical protein